MRWFVGGWFARGPPCAQIKRVACGRGFSKVLPSGQIGFEIAAGGAGWVVCETYGAVTGRAGMLAAETARI